MSSVRLPLSNAETVFMPELHPATVPLRVLFCNWCHVKLTAIPDQPVEEANLSYHPSCLDAKRAAQGVVTARLSRTLGGLAAS